MALTSIERRLLVEARERIRDDRDTYICYAIERICKQGRNISANTNARDRLCSYIASKLRGNGTLGRYMCNRYGQSDYMSADLQRKARIAWITWMLGEPVEIDAVTQRQFLLYMRQKPNAA